MIDFVKQLIEQRKRDGQINDKGQICDPDDIKQIGFLLGCEVVEDKAKNSEDLTAFLHALERAAFCKFMPYEDTVFIELCDKNKETIISSSSFSQNINILEVVDFVPLANKIAITEGFVQGIAFSCGQH